MEANRRSRRSSKMWYPWRSKRRFHQNSSESNESETFVSKSFRILKNQSDCRVSTHKLVLQNDALLKGFILKHADFNEKWDPNSSSKIING